MNFITLIVTATAPFITLATNAPEGAHIESGYDGDSGMCGTHVLPNENC